MQVDVYKIYIITESTAKGTLTRIQKMKLLRRRLYMQQKLDITSHICCQDKLLIHISSCKHRPKYTCMKCSEGSEYILAISIRIQWG
jgi:hypothetical protein